LPSRSLTLALRVSVLAVTVGVAVTAMAGFSGTSGCSGSVSGAVDLVCYHLVRTLAERMGLVTAAATAIVVLTMIGLARTAGVAEAARLRQERSPRSARRATQRT
jgi:hypothetical protein